MPGRLSNEQSPRPRPRALPVYGAVLPVACLGLAFVVLTFVLPLLSG
jgi:hypothetical protein